MEVYSGRVIIDGSIKGEAIVTKQGLNTLAVFMKSIVFKSKKAIGLDENNKDLFKKRIDGKILCLPDSIGSTTAGLVYMNLTKMNIAPLAMLFSKKIDSLAAAGVILSDVWQNEKIITIDNLGNEFLESVHTGQMLEIDKGGRVKIES